jgi:hypothetical protein
VKSFVLGCLFSLPLFLSLPSETEAGPTTRFYKTLSSVIRRAGFDIDALITKDLGIKIQSCRYTRYTGKAKNKVFKYKKLSSCLYHYLDEGLISNGLSGKINAVVFWPQDKNNENPSDVEIVWKPSFRKGPALPWYRPIKKIVLAVKNIRSHFIKIIPKKPVRLTELVGKAKLSEIFLGETTDLRFRSLIIKTKPKAKSKSALTGVLDVYIPDKSSPFLTANFDTDLKYFNYEIGKDFEDDLERIVE